MRRRALLSGIAGLLLIGTASAAPAARWHSLAKRRLRRHAGMVALAVPDEASRFLAIRLKLTGGDLLLRSLTLRYADGHRETHPWGAMLRRGATTPILQLAPGRKLVSVLVDHGSFTGNRYLQLVGSADVPPVPLPGRAPRR